ncbi:MAG: hypothetical protein K2I20_06055 [Clostridia bacterium]|nr:hypothetical protein [Clostridia bacterium]
MIKDLLRLIGRILFIILTLAGIAFTVTGVLELFAKKGPGMLIGGIICFFLPQIFLFVYCKSPFGKKSAEKEHKEDSKCEKCGRSIGGCSYEYTSKLTRASYDYGTTADVFITAHCPHCKRKKSFYLNVYKDESSITPFKYQIEEKVKNFMNSLDY